MKEEFRGIVKPAESVGGESLLVEEAHSPLGTAPEAVPVVSEAEEDQRATAILERIDKVGVDQSVAGETVPEDKKEKRELDKNLVWVVSNRFYDVDGAIKPTLKDTFGPDVQIQSFFRDYHFEDAAEMAEKLPALIVTNGTCKTRDEHGQSVGIYYDYPAQFAKENGIKVISPTVMGAFLPKVFKLKLRVFTTFHK